MDQRTARSVETSLSRSHGISRPQSLLARLPIFGSLEHRDFRWLLLGGFASNMGMNMHMITRGWLVLRLADDSPLALALAMISFALPMAFVSLIAGALADRVPRRHIVMASQAGSAILTILLATLDIAGLVAFWHVLVIGFFNGALMASNIPSRVALISDIVPENRLMNAFSLDQSSQNLSRIIGPAVAGVLIIFVETAGVFYLVGGIYLFAMLSLVMVNAGAKAVPRSGKGMTGDIREGLAYASRNPTIMGLIIMAFIPVFFGFTYFILLPVWAREALDVRSDDLGMLMMFLGVGALFGTLGLAAMPQLRRRGLLMLGVCIVWGIALIAFSQTTSYASAIPLLLVVGLVSSLFMSLNVTLIQLYTTPDMRGRVMGIGMMTWGLMPLSALPFGVIAEHMGTPNALGLSGVLLTAFTLLFAVGYPSFRKIA